MSVSEEAMVDPDKPDNFLSPTRETELSVGRVTKGVAYAIGKRLSVERDTALPDRLARLVDHLHAGPLGRSALKPRRVA